MIWTGEGSESWQWTNSEWRVATIKISAGEIMLLSRNRDSPTPSRLVEVPQGGVVAAVQSTNVGSRFFAMCDLELAVCGPPASSGWTAMVTQVGTIIGTVARLSGVPKRDVSLISFVAAIRGSTT